jgi:hypothetical protein
MPKLLVLAALLLSLTAALVLGRDPQPALKPAATEAGVSVYFSSRGGCTTIVAQIGGIRKFVLT